MTFTLRHDVWVYENKFTSMTLCMNMNKIFGGDMNNWTISAGRIQWLWYLGSGDSVFEKLVTRYPLDESSELIRLQYGVGAPVARFDIRESGDSVFEKLVTRYPLDESSELIRLQYGVGALISHVWESSELRAYLRKCLNMNKELRQNKD